MGKFYTDEQIQEAIAHHVIAEIFVRI